MGSPLSGMLVAGSAPYMKRSWDRKSIQQYFYNKKPLKKTSLTHLKLFFANFPLRQRDVRAKF